MTQRMIMAKDNKKKTGAVLVQGGGIAGVQASLDLANAGFKVYLLEKSSAVGGMMARLDKTFPTGDCATCIGSPKFVESARNLNIEILTLSELVDLEGEAGHYKALINRSARYINESKCTGCGACIEACPVTHEIYPEAEEKAVALLEETDQARIDAIINRHRDNRGGVMPILKEINSTLNYLPENVLRYIALELDMPLSLLYRIATFYNAFSLVPRGRHIINVCTGTTCYVRGADKILETLSTELGINAGETTTDWRFTLEMVRCLGCCSLAPVMRVDGEIYGRLKKKEVMEVLQQYD